MFRTVLTSLLAVLVLCGSAFAAEKTLIAAANPTWPPMEFLDENKNIIGYDRDIIAAIAEEIGMKSEFRNIAWDGIFASLESGQANVIASCVTITDKRKKAYVFSDPYYEVHQAVVVAKDSAIKKPEDLKGKKVAMTWAYSPSYGKPLSVPQGVIGLMTRFGMDVVLAHPEGYEVMGGVEEVARRNAAATGGSFARTNDMAEAFAGADIVYPKSWAPFAAMQQRTDLYGAGDMDGIKKLEKELLAQNANHKDWECTEALMASTRNGEALYMHCLPADISGVSCAEGEVAASVFDRYRVPLYKEASYKPYIIAAMIFLSQVKDPARALMELDQGKEERKNF